MPLPGDNNNFDPLSMGVSGIAPINRALGQLSYAITQLQTGGASFELVTIPIMAGVSLTARDAAYLNPSDNKMYAIDANAAPAFAGTIRGFVEETVSVGVLGALVIGGILGGFSGLTVWLPVYVDSTGDGTVTQTPPYPLLDSGQMAIVPMGMAISATQVAVMPAFMDCRIRYQKRTSPALDETITIEHGQNRDGFGRRVAAFVTQNNTLTEYASSNQDSDVQLEGQDGAGATISTNASGSSGQIGTNSGGVIVRRAQSFTITAGIFTTFDVEMSTNSGSPSGTITWSIQTNSGSVPSGTVLATGTWTPTASSVNTVNVPAGQQIFLSAATTYWLVFESTNTQSTNVFWQIVRQTTSSYANGTDALKLDAGAWSAQTGELDIAVTTAAITQNDKLAQGFQISSASDVSRFRLWLKKVGSPAGNLTVKIQTDTAGNPSGVTVTNGTSATVAASSLSTSYGYIEFTFSTPPSLSSATQYHLVLETADSQSNTNYVVWGADGAGPAYSNGVMKRERAAAWSSESKDAVFQVVADGTQYVNEVAVDWWTSTKADMVNQAGDSSGASVDTKTTFKCKLAAGFADITCEVVL